MAQGKSPVRVVLRLRRSSSESAETVVLEVMGKIPDRRMLRRERRRDRDPGSFSRLLVNGCSEVPFPKLGKNEQKELDTACSHEWCHSLSSPILGKLVMQMDRALTMILTEWGIIISRLTWVPLSK